MAEALVHSLIESAIMIPFLLIIYIGIEFLEMRLGTKINDKIKNAGRAGPAIGTVFGLVPQCGFSVISSILYSRRMITRGTLLAVFLATSDEAIPVILAQPEMIGVLLPLLAVKVCIALIAGYAIDLVLAKSGKAVAESQACASRSGSGGPINCCGSRLTEEKNNFGHWIIHPLIHTVKVFSFIFIVTLLLNYIMFQVGEENMGQLFLGDSILQPFIAALIGLIPSCAASVAVTEVFLKGGISFGSAVAGLSSAAGLGILVLFKENRNIKENLLIMCLLFAVSVAIGTILHLIIV
ncbi:putative manganese transporter [Phosphitispora sp. TUW77]|uniref:putative manganese transporter n=1 Tax=Phosphitispora sp. TUW77 TaxID=3152361 RepID=UPI003AB8E765